MQGIVIDDNGAYVKAAIIKITKSNDPAGKPEAEAVTYAETDEEGVFEIGDIDPGAKYIIEIHVKKPIPDSADKKAPVDAEELDRYDEELEPDDDIDELPAGNVIVDSLAVNNMTHEIVRENISVCGLYNIGYEIKNKAYLKKNNLW